MIEVHFKIEHTDQLVFVVDLPTIWFRLWDFIHLKPEGKDYSKYQIVDISTSSLGATTVETERILDIKLFVTVRPVI